MNKDGLVKAIVEKTGMAKKDIEKAVEAYQEVVVETLYNGESISLYKYGKFEVVERKEREGRNPKTNTKIIIPASKGVKFTFADSIKKGINQ